MKKNLKVAIASSALLLSGAVCALDFDPKFYLGAEAGINQLKISDVDDDGDDDAFKKTAASGAAFLGTRLFENMGIELGYTAFGAFKNKDESDDEKVSIKLKSPHVDILGYLPFATNFDLIASVGFGRLTGTSKVTELSTGDDLYSYKIKGNALRLGLGLQYKFDENLGARLMLRHQHISSLKVNNVKNTDNKMQFNSAALGLFYQF